MQYQLKIERDAERELDRLPGHMRQRIRRAIGQLTLTPRPSDAKRMSPPHEDKWRLRIENYRVIYTIDDETILITVIHVAKRTPKTYEGL